MKDSQPNHRRRARLVWPRYSTNFFPSYGEENAGDRVEAIGPVQPVIFQRVIPRYDLSTSETREAGVGPMMDGDPLVDEFYASMGQEPKPKRSAEPKPASRSGNERYPRTQGNVLDIEA